MLSTILFERQQGFINYKTENCYEQERKLYSLQKLSKVNIFVGANNSGKSRFARQLFLEYPAITNSEKEFYSNFAREFSDVYKKNLELYGLKKIENVNEIYEGLYSGGKLNEAYAYCAWRFCNHYLRNKEFNILLAKTDNNVEQQLQRNSSAVQWIKEIQGRFKDEAAKVLKQSNNRNLFSNRIYLPVLRSLRSFCEDKQDIYTQKIQEEYFAENNKVNIFTGLTFYEDLKALLLGERNQRETVKEFESFLAENFFENKEVTLIPKLKPKELVAVKIGNEKERSIHDLGDGIQAIIILTFPLFVYKEKSSMIVVEEPELFMHPGIQRIFLDAITNKFEKHQFFLTTHSNHFLDLTMDFDEVSIFSFEKELDSEPIEAEARFKIENLSHGSYRPMELLGVRNSSVLLSNCTVWVEGITDRLYLDKYLELYQEKLKKEAEAKNEPFRKMRKDFEFSFVEYGGNNITHWSFLDEASDGSTIDTDKLCGKLFLIADNDNPEKGSKKALRQKALKNKLGNRFYSLKCSEVENLLSPRILNLVLEDYGEDNDAINCKWEDYSQEKLGAFIDEKLGKRKKRSGNYASKSKTVNDKLRFCKRAISHMKDWADLSKEAQKLTRKIYDFIMKNNI